MMDFENLQGAQRAVLAEAIREVVGRKQDFDNAMDGADLPLMDDLVAPDGYTRQLLAYIRVMQSRAELQDVVDALVKSEFGNNRVFTTLADRLSLVEPIAADSLKNSFNLQRHISGSEMVDLFGWSERLINYGQSMCRISFPSGLGQTLGTGFALSPTQVLTNYHVIEPLLNDSQLVPRVKLVFGYAEVSGTLQIGPKAELAPDWHHASAPYAPFDEGKSTKLPAPSELDYALLNLLKPVEGIGTVTLPDAAFSAKENDIVFVLQHPEGQPLKLAMGLVTVLPVSNRLRYSATTLAGSSGALVLDDQLRPLALHHAGDPNFKTMAKFNQGIPLSLINTNLNNA